MAQCELTEQQWAELRAEWENGASISALSKKYGTTRKTIGKRVVAQAWTLTTQGVDRVSSDPALSHHLAREASRSKLVHLAEHRIQKRFEAGGELDAVVDDIAQDLSLHSGLARLMVDATTKGLNNYIAGRIAPGPVKNEADVIAQLVAAGKAAMQASREIHGKRTGDPSITTTTHVAGVNVRRMIVREDRDSA